MQAPGARRRSDRIATAGAIIAAVAFNIVWMGRGVIVLNAGLLAAYGIWATRAPLNAAAMNRLLPVYLVAVGVQVLHFGEEYATGFQRAFPALFGGTWSDGQFVTFNLIWVAVFVLAAIGVRGGFQPSLVVVWFLALIGGIGNGIAHLGISLATRSYFPGTITAPFMLVLGILLIGRLREPTEHVGTKRGWQPT